MTGGNGNATTSGGGTGDGCSGGVTGSGGGTGMFAFRIAVMVSDGCSEMVALGGRPRFFGVEIFLFSLPDMGYIPIQGWWSGDHTGTLPPPIYMRIHWHICIIILTYIRRWLLSIYIVGCAQYYFTRIMVLVK